jgi:hypothetical protein
MKFFTAVSIGKGADRPVRGVERLFPFLAPDER